MKNDSFLYQTVRAEHWVSQKGPKGLAERHGPFATEAQAYGMIEILRARALSIHTFNVEYVETPVDIEPILAGTIENISEKIDGWLDSHLIQNKKRRKVVYLSEGEIRRSLKTLAKEIRERTFALNLENKHASSET